jgi:hypothetical protein
VNTPDRSDAEQQLAKIQRVREVLRCTRVVLGLVVLLGLSSLYLASAGPIAGMYARIFLWLAIQALAIAGVVFILRAIRRRRFGAAPSARIRKPSDALLAVAATVGGTIALVGFTPDLLAGSGRAIDLAIVGIGALLAAGGLRIAGLYVLRE